MPADRLRSGWPSGEGSTTSPMLRLCLVFLHFRAYFDRCPRMGGGPASDRCGGARKAPGLRGKMALGGAEGARRHDQRVLPRGVADLMNTRSDAIRLVLK